MITAQDIYTIHYMDTQVYVSWQEASEAVRAHCQRTADKLNERTASSEGELTGQALFALFDEAQAGKELQGWGEVYPQLRNVYSMAAMLLNQRYIIPCKGEMEETKRRYANLRNNHVLDLKQATDTIAGLLQERDNLQELVADWQELAGEGVYMDEWEIVHDELIRRTTELLKG